jgi:hypothetical protein
VLLANLITGIAVKAYLVWETEQAMKIRNQQLDDLRQQSERARLQNEARRTEQDALSRQQAAQRQRALQQNQAAIRQARETCDYWRQQVAQNGTGYNRLMRESACGQLRLLQ